MFDKIEIQWKRPQILPEFYFFVIKYHSPVDGKRKILTSSKIPTHMTRSVVRVDAPAECNITFFAVYNRAGIDSGITKIVRTKQRRE